MTSGVTRKEGDILGDYRLGHAVSEGRFTRTWEGEQLSMQRLVMIEMLRSKVIRQPGVVNSFISDVRAKAMVTHPGIGAVYEVFTNDDDTFFSREKLDGDSLESLYQSGSRFSPLEIVILLGQIAEAMWQLKIEEVATVDYELHHFVIAGKDEVRVMNLAVKGARDEQIETRTKQLLGGVFDAMTRPGLPGATRVKSLCNFMTDANRPMPLTWKQILDLSHQVRDQLQGRNKVVPSVAGSSGYQLKEPPKVAASFWALIGGVASISGVILLMIFSNDKKKPASVQAIVKTKAYIDIPRGRYKVPGGWDVSIREGFAISRTEVTLGQYKAFLDFPDHRRFQHPEQPVNKKTHEPNDWDVVWPAAVRGKTWLGRAMTIECPVVGIDWWDAYAYAQWSQSRLPELSEWMVAAGHEGQPRNVSLWGPVGRDQMDVTGVGLAGMAGNVREWTAVSEINPAESLAPKAYVAAGASFENQGDGILARLWVDSRSIRRSDLGFRVIAKK
ncbi:MAG: SUMF1/EgtB/PvdO family nonheme iron enzyme [Akkermansiaceae bacterium]|nr:SUMF1/EgtB/PvdO family nonheme iron enzyme [Akkermansiaceae bacterium]